MSSANCDGKVDQQTLSRPGPEIQLFQQSLFRQSTVDVFFLIIAS